MVIKKKRIIYQSELHTQRYVQTENSVSVLTITHVSRTQAWNSAVKAISHEKSHQLYLPQKTESQ